MDTAAWEKNVERPSGKTGLGAEAAFLVRRAAPNTEHFGQVFNSRRGLDPRTRHSGLELIRRNKRPRLFHILPFEHQGQFVGVLDTAENAAIALAILGSPIERGIEFCFPVRIV